MTVNIFVQLLKSSLLFLHKVSSRTIFSQEAGGGNRTRMISLEGWSFTTKLHPRASDLIKITWLL